MSYIKTGYIHLINTATSTLTCSDVEFDTVQSGIGSHLEKALDKILDKHDRRPGEFKKNSKIKKYFEDYAAGRLSLKDLSHEIANEVAGTKFDERIVENSILFVLEGSDSIYVIDVKRSSHYVIKTEIENGERRTSIYEEGLSLPNIRTNNIRFFEVDLRTMKLNTLEKIEEGSGGDIYLFADVVLRADMNRSINQYLKDGRQAFYNTVLADQPGDKDIDSFKSKENIDLLNDFEDNIFNQHWNTGEIDFPKAGEEIFYSDIQMRKKFFKQLEIYGVNKFVRALSKIPIMKKTLEYKPKRIYLKNGVQVLVPDEIEELDIKLIEVDGELKELELEES